MFLLFCSFFTRHCSECRLTRDVPSLYQQGAAGVSSAWNAPCRSVFSVLVDKVLSFTQLFFGVVFSHIPLHTGFLVFAPIKKTKKHNRSLAWRCFCDQLVGPACRVPHRLFLCVGNPASVACPPPPLYQTGFVCCFASESKGCLLFAFRCNGLKLTLPIIHVYRHTAAV